MPHPVFSQLVAGLLLWSLVSLGAATVGLYVQASEKSRAFWFMTGMWGLIDGGLAWSGLVRAPSSPAELAPLLLFNAGLDVVYLAVGAVLLTRQKPALKGFGLAVLIQGAFLLGFDLYFWWRCTNFLG